MAQLYGDWNKAINRLSNMHTLLDSNIKQVTKRNAVSLRDGIKRTIRSGRSEWKPLSGLTIQRKGSARPLVDNNDLFHSINVKKIAKHLAFVGVPRAAKSRERVKMVNIARVLEFGATITPKKARFLTIPTSKKASTLVREAGGVRNIPDLFALKGSGGRPVALARKTGGGGFEVMFVLLQKAVIPPRSFIQSTFNDMKKKLAGRYEDAVRSALRGVRYSA